MVVSAYRRLGDVNTGEGILDVHGAKKPVDESKSDPTGDTGATSAFSGALPETPRYEARVAGSMWTGAGSKESNPENELTHAVINMAAAQGVDLLGSVGGETLTSGAMAVAEVNEVSAKSTSSEMDELRALDALMDAELAMAFGVVPDRDELTR